MVERKKLLHALPNNQNEMNAPAQASDNSYDEEVKLQDPYALDPGDITNPPRSLFKILRMIGPGLILAASIIGSGELIATTTLGAEVGYIALWVVLLSCLIKPIVQAELGRYTIASGETGLEGFNFIPGIRLFKVNWIVWAWAIMVLLTQLQVGAMYGGVSQVMNLIFPVVPVNVWVMVFLAITLALLLGGGYNRIEILAMVKVGLFTMLTILAAVLLIKMPQYFSWRNVLQGITFKLPGNGITTAVAVFGITGVGTTELFMYPYWCVEKGYARFVGKRDESPQWQERASGWIRIMHIDIIISMTVYTIATVAFYLLGAGILHGMGLVPSAKDMISVLSNIYTQTLGPWAVWLFYIGAIATLYGTIFAATAAHSRLFADMSRLMGFFEKNDYRRRVAFRNGFVILLTIIPVLLFFFIESPVKMVIAGGVSQSLMLPIACIGILYLHHKRLPGEVAPKKIVTVALWISSLFIIFMMIFYFLSI